MDTFMAGFWFVLSTLLCIGGLILGIAGIINATHGVWETAAICAFISEGLIILGSIGWATFFSLDA